MKKSIKKIGLVVLNLICVLVYGASDTSDVYTLLESDSTFLAEDSINYSVLDLVDNGEFESFEIFDSIVQHKRAFFIGENHTYRKSNTRVQIKMLKYLYEKRGTRYLLFEFGPSIAWMVNNYVQTGDTTYFAEFKSYTFLYYQRFYESLKVFNDSLPEGEKIHVVGIDIERSLPSAAKFLGLLIPQDKEAPDSIELHVESLKGLEAYHDKFFKEYFKDTLNRDNESYEYDYSNSSYFSAKSTIDALSENFDKQTELYKSYLGENFDQFNNVLDGLKAYDQWLAYSYSNAYQEWVYREMYMYNNFLRLAQENPEASFMGSFGRCHTSINQQSEWCDLYQFKSLVHRINNSKDSTISNQVLSLGTFYPRSFSDKISDKEQEELDTLINKTKDDQIVAYKIYDDSVNFSSLKDKFHFVIVNKFNPDLETREKEIELEKEEEWGTRSKTKTFLAFTYGAFSANLKNLNSHISFVDSDFEFNNYINTYSGSLWGANKRANWGLDFAWFNAQKGILSNDNQIKFQAFTVSGLVGYDLIKNRHFDFVFSGGLGIGQMNFEEKLDISNGASLFGSELTSVFTNPVYSALVQFNARINIRTISIGFKAGYQYDYSNGGWKLANESIIDRSPDVWLTGLYGGVTVALTNK